MHNPLNGQILQWQARPSRLLGRLIVSAHFLAVSACGLSSLPVALKASLMAVIGLHLGWQVWIDGQRPPDIVYGERRGWELDGQPIEVLASTVVSQYMVFLHYRYTLGNGARQRSAVMVFDAFDEEGYRGFVAQLKTTFANPQATGKGKIKSAASDSKLPLFRR